MRPGIYYLPEYHQFNYVARAPWPHIYNNYQQDWITAIEVLESWLTQHIGPHHSNWAYSQQINQDYWEACIAFRLDKYKTLFLLKWS